MKLIKEKLRLITFLGIVSLLLVTGLQANAVVQIDDNIITERSINSSYPIITDVTHTPTNPDSDSEITISAIITDSDGLSSKMLYYRAVGDISFNSTGLSQVGSTDEYQTSIGPYNAGLSVEYYIFAVDASPSHYSTTEDNGGLYYNFTVSLADYEAPAITNVQHTPETPTDNDIISISCNVTDASDVIVLLNYRVDGSEWANQTMTNTEGNYYTTTVGEFDADTLFEYRIYAIDQSLNNNTNLENAENENYYFTVVINDTEAPIISDILLEPETVLAGQKVIITCSVTDVLNNVLNVTLYYRINEGDWLQVLFTKGEMGEYNTEIGPFEAADVIDYYIKAFDDSTNYNYAINNNADFNYSFTVLEGTENSSLFVMMPIFALVVIGIITKRKR